MSQLQLVFMPRQEHAMTLGCWVARDTCITAAANTSSAGVECLPSRAPCWTAECKQAVHTIRAKDFASTREDRGRGNHSAMTPHAVGLHGLDD